MLIGGVSNYLYVEQTKFLQLTFQPPFDAPDRQRLIAKILKGNFVVPDEVTYETDCFLHDLMTVNPKRRLGSAGAQAIKGHRFFKGTCWESVLNRLEKPPYVPKVVSLIYLFNVCVINKLSER